MHLLSAVTSETDIAVSVDGKAPGLGRILQDVLYRPGAHPVPGRDLPDRQAVFTGIP
jgi:hypothetical protein